MTFDDIITDIIQDWAPDYLRKIKTDADKIPKLTGESIQTFRYAILKDQKIKGILISFAENLRYYDMRSVEWARVPNIDAMKEFVAKKGTSSFTTKFQAKYGYIPRDQTQLLNKLAWGIGLSIYKRGKWLAKRKKFYNKNTGTSINILYRQLIDALSDFTIKNLKNQNGS